MPKYYTLLIILLLGITGCDNNHVPHNAAAASLVADTVSKAIDRFFKSKDASRDNTMLLTLYDQYPDSITHGLICEALGKWYFINGIFDTSAIYSRKALSYLEQQKRFVKELARCYFLLGQSLAKRNNPNFFLANDYQTRAALLCNMAGADTIFRPDFRIAALYMASASNRRCELYEASLQYGKEGVIIGKQYKDSAPGEYGRALMEYSNILIYKNQYDSAWHYVSVARELNEQNIRDAEMGNDINNLTGWYYYKMGLYDSAATYCRSAVTYMERMYPGSSSVFSNYYSMADIYTRLQRKKEAAIFLNKAERMLAADSTIADPSTLADFTENKTHFNILFGDRLKTQKLFIDYIRQEKDFHNKEQLKMAEATYVEYDLAGKAEKIQFLNLQRMSAETALRTRTNLLTIAVLATLLAIAAVFVLILFQRQHKLKNAQQLLTTENSKIELEQRLLRTQMEPHFIFNALTNLLTLIDKGENEKASGYLLRFAQLLRTSLENSKENFVRLAEELNALENYLELQKMRFNDLFDFWISIEKDLDTDSILIPPMLIQPIVENAIIHGFKGIAYKGRLHIAIEKKEQQLYCTVQDNGIGLQSGESEQRVSSSAVITRERLAIFSRQTGQPASLSIMNIRDKTGVQVVLTMPFKEEPL